MKYIYDGPVVEGSIEICKHWHGETTAPSKAKAISNLKYQFNKQRGKYPYCKVEFPNIKQMKEN